jgi:protein required for attachment to host cells
MATRAATGITRVVVADEDARRHDRDLKSDRPGRLFERAPPTRGRRGAGARHATGGPESPRKHEAEVFARQISTDLRRAQRAGEFNRLVLIAGPPFLGKLRGVLSKGLRGVIVAEVSKNLIHQPESAIRDNLPRILSR